MGKKKDKASKSKKMRSAAEPLVQTEPRRTEYAEAETIHGPLAETEYGSEPVAASGDNRYAEYVSAQDVMELVNSLAQDFAQLENSNRVLQQQLENSNQTLQKQLENSNQALRQQLENSDQALQQQLTQAQKSPLPLYSVVTAITILLGIGIATGGYYGNSMNKHLKENMNTVSSRIDSMKTQVESTNNSMSSMSANMSKLNASVGSVSANLAALDENLNKVANTIGKKNTATTSTATPYDPYRMGYTRSPWR